MRIYHPRGGGRRKVACSPVGEKGILGFEGDFDGGIPSQDEKRQGHPYLEKEGSLHRGLLFGRLTREFAKEKESVGRTERIEKERTGGGS